MSLKVALTGNSFSGYGDIAKLFANQGVKVFDADVVLKFLFNYREDILKQVKIRLGSGVIDNNNFIIPEKFDTTEKFDKLLDAAWREVIYFYELWRLKNNKEPYTIFKCAVLFEYNKEKDFDRVINVFRPKNDRMEDYEKSNHIGKKVYAFIRINNELSDLEKNALTPYIVNNYPGYTSTNEAQVKKLHNTFSSSSALTVLSTPPKIGRVFMDNLDNERYD